MQDLNDMFLFSKVVEHGGYSAAARALGMPVSKLSRRIASLERELGVRLLNRTTRKVSLTDIGHTYYQHCAAVAAEARAAQDAIDRTSSQPQGLIRVSCPVGLLQSNVTDILIAYQVRYPLVRVHLEATSRRVDVVEEGFDVALRVRQPPFENSELVVRPLAGAASTLVASPEFLARHGRPATIEDLSALPTVSMAQAGDRYSWTFKAPDGRDVSVSHTPRLATDDLATLRQAVLAGVGIGLVPLHLVASHLQQGALEAVLPGYTLPYSVVQAVFASRRGLVPAVREFVDALVQGFEFVSGIDDERLARLPLRESDACPKAIAAPTA
ncbi:LysR substrate-binding domain-containing protein [Pigmentiphaga soli]